MCPGAGVCLGFFVLFFTFAQHPRAVWYTYIRMARERKSTQIDTGRPPCDQPSSHPAGKTILKFR